MDVLNVLKGNSAKFFWKFRVIIFGENGENISRKYWRLLNLIYEIELKFWKNFDNFGLILCELRKDFKNIVRKNVWSSFLESIE